jgi:hypothetical protein
LKRASGDTAGRRTMRANPYPSLDLIYKRDGGECWRCGAHVERRGRLPPNHPDAPSRHHVIPRYHKGPDVHFLVVTTHTRCNGQMGHDLPHPEDIPWHLIGVEDVVLARQHIRRLLGWWRSTCGVPKAVEDFLTGATDAIPLPT